MIRHARAHLIRTATDAAKSLPGGYPAAVSKRSTEDSQDGGFRGFPDEAFVFYDQTPELSRRFRALKVWLSLRYHGLGAFREAIGENLRQASLLAQLIESESALELLAPVGLSTVCFRWTGSDAATLDDRGTPT